MKMGLLNRIFGRRESKSYPIFWPDLGGDAQWRMTDARSYAEEGFSTNSLIYSAVSYKSRAVTSVPLRAYSGTPDSPVRLSHSHPLAELAHRPNEHQSFPEFQALNTVYLNVSGDSFVLLVREPGEEFPTSMYPLRPDRTYVIKKKDDGIPQLAGYVYVPKGMAREDGLKILPQDMIHVKLPNPVDDMEGLGYGLSPISPAARNADVDNSVDDFLKLFFEKGVILPGILTTEQPLNARDMARIRERWKEVYGGYENWAEEIGILEKGANYERIGLTFDEMGLESLDARNEAKMCGPFGIPPILIGARVALKHSSYKNYAPARKICWEDTIIPELTLFETEFQYRLNTEDAWVKFDYSQVPALRQNVADRVEAAYKLVQIGYSPNAATKAVGLAIEDSPIGDVSFMPVNMAPILAEGQEMPQVGAPPDGNGKEAVELEDLLNRAELAPGTE